MPTLAPFSGAAPPRPRRSVGRRGHLWLVACLFALTLGAGAAAGQTTVQWVDHPLVLSSVGPNNPLPAFFWSRVQGEGGSGGAWTKWDGTRGTAHPFTPPDTADELIWQNMQKDLRIPLLPWSEQDDWGCEQEPGTARMIQIENEYLSALIAPQFGGKIWRVYDKRLKQELFLNNRANQPVNFAVRKAWTSGGVEFNWSPGYIGHSVFTLSDVYAAKIDTKRGPVIRVWEYDRINSTTWQVDILLHGPTLFIHPKVANPNKQDLRGYWWTNCALKTEPLGEERVLMPAKWTYEHVEWPRGNYVLHPSTFAGLGEPFSPPGPRPWEVDSSWLGNLPAGNDFFMELCNSADASPGLPPHCAAVRHRAKPFAYISLANGTSGYTVVHGHRGLGTKFFTYGNAGSPYFDGQFLQDFMSASNLTAKEHLGNYLEEQTGRAPTQMNDFPLPASSSMAWTEWFQATVLPRETVLDYNYTRALNALDGWIESDDGVPQARFDELEAFFASVEDAPVAAADVLHRGQPWGGVEQRRRGGGALAPGQLYDEAPPPPGAPGGGFSKAAEVEAAPWRELVSEAGTFSPATLERLPASFAVSAEWEAAVRRSASTHGNTWLHELHAGVAAAERFDEYAAREAFESSMRMRPSGTAARNLALMADTARDAWGLYMLAWNTTMAWNDEDPTKPALLGALSREIATFGVATPGFLMELAAWLAAQDRGAAWQGGDPVRFARLALAMASGKYDEAIDVLASSCWQTYMQSHGEELAERWFEAQAAVEEAKAGRALTPWERRQLRQLVPPPPNIGFSCEGISC